MTVPDVLLELAARCEAAEGPDRELDALIAVAAKQVPYDFEPAFGTGNWRAIYDDRHWQAPGYTASIDATLTLVPAGHTWTLYANGCAGVCPKLDEDDLADGTIWAATPALALCAAALRARKERGE